MACGAAPCLRRLLDALNAGAPVALADHGRIAARLLFEIGLYDPQTKSIDVASWLAQAAHHHAHDHDHHDADIQTFVILREQPIRAATLTLFLEALAEHCGAGLLRLKGIVNIAESQRPAVIHGVQHVFHAPAWLERWPSDDHRSRLVFIVRRMPRRWVEALLAAIDAEVAAVSESATA